MVEVASVGAQQGAQAAAAAAAAHAAFVAAERARLTAEQTALELELAALREKIARLETARSTVALIPSSVYGVYTAMSTNVAWLTYRWAGKRRDGFADILGDQFTRISDYRDAVVDLDSHIIEQITVLEDLVDEKDRTLQGIISQLSAL